jgi:hypothetical protein
MATILHGTEHFKPPSGADVCGATEFGAGVIEIVGAAADIRGETSALPAIRSLGPKKSGRFKSMAPSSGCFVPETAGTPVGIASFKGALSGAGLVTVSFVTAAVEPCSVM